MKKILHLLLPLQFLIGFACAQVQRPFTPRYYNPSVRGNIVYVANNIITSPLRNNAEAPPGGTAVNDTTVANYIDVAPLVTVIPWNSTWKFCDSGYAPGGTAWRNVGYNDANWSSATADVPTALVNDIGYGDLDEVTPYVYANCGSRPGTALPVCGAKYWTTYFRQKVTISNIADYVGFQINLHRDDGAVVYVNGTEVYRTNMPATVINYNTPASAGMEGATEDVSVNIPATAFISGVNQIAVEVHQYVITNTADGNDMSFRMELLGDNTFSSSSADLSIPSCSNILFAGLYWGAATNDILGVGSTMAWITGEKNIKIKVPGAVNFTTVTSTQTDYHNLPMIYGRIGTGYRAFADITSLLNGSNPNGTYMIGNMVGPNNLQNGSGGWAIVIAYGNPTLQPRNLTVMDGSAIMNGGDPALTIGLSGFLTPPSGPVSCELGAIIYDGDRGSPDEFSFKQDSNRLVGTYKNLTPNGASNLNDMWNSTISYKGVVVTTRNPAHKNTLGFDADIIDVPNTGNLVLGNNKATASIHFSSTFENYFIHAFTTSIAVYSPSFSFYKESFDISGGTLTPGDSLRYGVKYENVGNDTSMNTVITDNIPLGTTYKPGTIKIGGVAKTDAAGDDEAEYDLINNRIVFRVGTGATAVTGGRVDQGKKGDVAFDVIIASSCELVACINPVKNTARLTYTGVSNALNQTDSSGLNNGAGCVSQGAMSTALVGTCKILGDTILTNKCPALNALIPWRRYAGYTIYSAKPFIPANIYDATVPVAFSHVYWAYYATAPGCADTIKLSVFIVGCPDIDDDNDGIPDYVEINNPVALQDHNNNGIPNWKDPAYPGYIDNNADGFNDNFDPGADADNDGIPNFYDASFAGYVDTNGDHVNDKMDKDMDGIPNHLDLDSDNDGIPDVVESYGVDANGDGVIDNYTDTDNDGLSQNVDASNTGVSGSGNGLGAQDLENDGVPNYLDLDSDNDGIPDLIEVMGADANNDGMIDVYADQDADGFSDNVDGDVGNDGVAENSANALLRTGVDVSPADGKADNYPYKNFDSDKRANPYDIDSDMDGIVDAIEAGFSDVNLDGYVDGAIGADGWNAAINAGATLVLVNTDGRGGPDYLDIDSDDDGIPDNIEGQTTASYKLPSGLDTDGDGLDNSYDNTSSFAGRGVSISDKDMDGIPDYRDLDTDSDGSPDIDEGNDFNRNTQADDNVTLTLIDTDGDGLDNRFDSLNSVTNIKGTSYNMGNGGNTVGDPTPGAKAPVSKSMSIMTDRDWRSVGYVLDVRILDFVAFSQEYNNALLTWTLLTTDEVDHFEIERSIDNVNFLPVIKLVKSVTLNETLTFSANDDITDVSSATIYYRLKVIGKSGLTKYSEVRAVRKNVKKAMVNIFPNPASDKITIQVYTEKEGEATIRIIDNAGRVVSNQKQHLVKGNNTVTLNDLSRFSNGIYNFQCLIEADVILKKISIRNP
jgi:uncharacterized repeat protein (TIGR01451 family)